MFDRMKLQLKGALGYQDLTLPHNCCVPHSPVLFCFQVSDHVNSLSPNTEQAGSTWILVTQKQPLPLSLGNSEDCFVQVYLGDRPQQVTYMLMDWPSLSAPLLPY